MDSGNSGSLQSSSGGDEENDSRSETSLPAFLNSSTHFGSLSSSTNPQASLLHHHHHHQQQQQQQQPSLFDPSPNLFRALSQTSQNSNLNHSVPNLNVVRPHDLQFDPSYSNIPGSTSTHPVMSIQGSGQGLVSSHDNGVKGHQGGVGKNPKKRTRASRRAPTTVLTTDTSNFRAMVQEFTGIPAPPFSGSPYVRRLDLFGAGSSMRASHLESMLSLYPVRPSAQKVHQQSPFVSSTSPFLNNSVVDSTNNIGSSISNHNNNVTITPTTTSSFTPDSISYPLPSDLGLPKQPQNMINMQTQMHSFQSLLQPHLLNVQGLDAKSQASLPLPSLDDDQLDISHGGHVNANLSGLPSHVTTERLQMRSIEGHNGANNRSQENRLRPSFNGHFGNSLQRVNSTCKLNYSASSSEFHHEKGLENVSSRGEGTVDSWICPSE